jgi:chromosome segregation ATPase
MAKDDIDSIPSIIPSRDRDYTLVQTATSAPRKKSGNGGGKPPVKQAGSGLLSRLFITVALVIAAIACAWAWQLQEQLKQASNTMNDYELRIGDLEARLSDTDEGMSQNAAVQAAKIRDLDTAVRKLWDNVWKQSKERLGKLEASSKTYNKKIAANEKSLKATQTKVSSAANDLAKLKNVSGDLSRLISSAKANQAEVERVADTLNRINLDLAKINRQVKSNEEGIRATDAFRRQVNGSINELEGAIRALQSAP